MRDGRTRSPSLVVRRANGFAIALYERVRLMSRYTLETIVLVLLLLWLLGAFVVPFGGDLIHLLLLVILVVIILRLVQGRRILD